MVREAIRHALRWATLVLAAAVFLAACCMPVGHGHGGFLEEGFEPDGIQVLFLAWLLGGLDGILAWLANPVMILTSVCLASRNYPLASFCSAIALGLALLPFAILADGGGISSVRLHSPIALVFGDGHLELRVGYFLWSPAA